MPKDLVTDDKSFIFGEIDSKNPNRVQLMRTIDAKHSVYGSVKVTSEDLKSFKKNFEDGIVGIELAVDYAHNAHLEAAAWIKGIELANNDNELWIDVEYTPEGQKKVNDKEFRYLSADFSHKHIDKETGKVYGATLYGAGLTNRPFIKGMNAILSDINNVELSEEQISKIHEVVHGKDEKPKQKDDEMNLSEITEAAKTLSETEKTELANAMGLKLEASDTEKQLSDANAKIATLEAANKKLSEDAVKSEKERKFDVMLSDGKAVEAQREAYLLGDVDKFAELSEEVNLSEKGADEDEGGADQPKTAEEAANKLSEIATKIAEDQNIEFSDALAQAIDENEKLYALSEKEAA